ncbi:lipopolysaccharide (LPS) heptosyltransferase [Acetobacter aceti NRIC 0242]|uniref:Glycosyl transferase n=1 Tax=Acetobacter aceti NBRC 14818 TaxID=887700 RepID=A0AB33IKE7_ACEAC|nr:glycosyltransferase family 9 protein [Acetobacter aceti]TCS33400.1 ADP-heptose:LPS heptosyltransferase [Acetobacter aceti NBRC 14818]BCK77567.1 glycosyl transferase [Acetobacter aceti NBRC 14818]GAN56794.1 lipopolysaccharide heptosyl transferase/glycosyl transferase [Acetobacter aceti NBRC 14818]GBO80407.1 lipopolysaccharide (LPS) heptosyltransferase [Acetobacter aceti NRIC 0242]
MRILFITATRLGDAVISTGLLNYLIQAHPDARFTVVCGPVAAGLFQRMPQLDRVIVMAKRPYDLHWFDLWKQCVGTRWDLVVDLRGSAISLLLRTRARRIMRGGRRPGARIAHVGDVLSLSPPPLPVVWTSEEDRALAGTILIENDIIAFGPTANWAGKVWPAQYFVELWSCLARIFPNRKLAVFYGPGEAERSMAAPVLAIPGAIDAGGRFTLAETAAMLQRCALFIGNDSGLMHLAAAAQTPTLGLFGPSRSSEYAPSGVHAEWIAAPGPEGAAPISGLKPEQVLERLLSMMSGREETSCSSLENQELT